MYLSIYVINSIPFFVKAVIFIPTGIDNKAEINAICSLPVPEANEMATSKSFESKGFSFS